MKSNTALGSNDPISMNNGKDKTVVEAFEAAFSESSDLKFGFEDAVRYNEFGLDSPATGILESCAELFVES